MTRPLYHTPLPPALANDGHFGLWYDKFPDNWTGLAGAGTPEFADKSAWVKAMAGRSVTNHPIITEYAARQNAMALACGGTVLLVKTEGPFATGLGREHPVENGFAWHATLGMPYLPGSGLKGLARTWASQWVDADPDVIARVFGPAHNEALSVGSVVFCDLLPTKGVKLLADVMTPHYGKWHQGDATVAPGDYLDPNPIPFLAVDVGQGFQTVVMPRTPADARDAALAAEWLLAALENLGAGAKTAAGYGRFVKDAEGERLQQAQIAKIEKEKAAAAAEAERAERMSSMTPIRQEMEADNYSDAKAFAAGNGVFKKWIDRMKATGDAAERQEIAELLRDLHQELYPKDWQTVAAGGGKPAGKDKVHDRIREILKALG